MNWTSIYSKHDNIMKLSIDYIHDINKRIKLYKDTECDWCIDLLDLLYDLGRVLDDIHGIADECKSDWQSMEDAIIKRNEIIKDLETN